MTQLDIQLLLEKAYESNFLDSLQILSKANKEYKKSEYYKDTKIPLIELYKGYYQYAASQYSFGSKISEFLGTIDSDELVEKISSLLQKLQNDPEIQKIFNTIMENFDIQSLNLSAEELKKAIKQLKK